MRKAPFGWLSELMVSLGVLLAALAPACDSVDQTHTGPTASVQGDAVALTPTEGLRAPATPPDATLSTLEGKMPGIIVHFNWIIGSKRKLFDLDPPIPWPQTDLSLEETTFSVISKFAPRIVEIRQYRDVPANGVPNLKEATSYACSVTKVGTAADDDCQIERGSSGWDVHVSLDVEGGAFLTLYAYWFDHTQAEAQTRAAPGGGFEAAWIF
jgi:hypothetical protein